MNGVNIKSSENKMLSEYAWKNESVAQKLHVWDDKCMKIGYNEKQKSSATNKSCSVINHIQMKEAAE